MCPQHGRCPPSALAAHLPSQRGGQLPPRWGVRPPGSWYPTGSSAARDVGRRLSARLRVPRLVRQLFSPVDLVPSSLRVISVLLTEFGSALFPTDRDRGGIDTKVLERQPLLPALPRLCGRQLPRPQPQRQAFQGPALPRRSHTSGPTLLGHTLAPVHSLRVKSERTQPKARNRTQTAERPAQGLQTLV